MANNKMREALNESRRIASDLGGCRLNDYWKLNEIVRVCDAALAEPVRNYEVGTAKEQAERFAEYCDSEVCKRNRCRFNAKALCIERCALAWSQLPYEEGGAK